MDPPYEEHPFRRCPALYPAMPIPPAWPRLSTLPASLTWPRQHGPWMQGSTHPKTNWPWQHGPGNKEREAAPNTDLPGPGSAGLYWYLEPGTTDVEFN